MAKFCRLKNASHTFWLIGDDYITEAYERANLEGYMRSAVRLLDLMPYRLEYNDYELIDFIPTDTA